MADVAAGGAPLRGISSMATRHVLGELSTAYGQRSGQAVAIESVGGVDAARRIEAGEALDLAVLAGAAIDALERSGLLLPGSRVDVATSDVAIAVATGAARPAIDTEAALRDALLRARAIGYSTGPSGTHLMRLLQRWNIADDVAARLVQAPPGVPVGTLVAQRRVDLGLQQRCELLHVPGIDIVGGLPPEVQAVTVFAGGVCATTARAHAARDFLAFLASPEADDAKRRHGMAPAASG